jgi:glycosyltransferase involved in cell wall biosynthesis
MSNEILKSKNSFSSRVKKVTGLFTKVFVILKAHHQGKGIFHFFFSSTGKKLVKKFFTKMFSIVLNNDKEERKKLEAYADWRKKNAPTEEDYKTYKANLEKLSYQPKISILVPVYNTPAGFLEATINSVIDQIYPNWELCLADDNSPLQETKEVLKKYATLDPRIKVFFREKNGHISACTNSAIDLATGEFCALFDHDDLLAKEALYEVVKFLNAKPEADFIYSDEDKTDGEGLFMEPHFKPAWCPDNLLSRNYPGHLTTMRTSILKEIGGFKIGFEGSQDYDIYLRFTEKTKNIFHLPKVLYHWRMHENSVALNTYSKPYAYIAGQKAIAEAIARRNEPGEVIMHTEEMLGFYTIRYKIKEYKKVSIIIPAKNKPELLRQCVDSIFAKTTYKDFEVIVVDNGSTEKEFLELVKVYENRYPGKFISYPHDIPFNFSSLINFGVEKAKGEYFLLLNNDTEVITPDWIEAMVEQAQRPSIGVVGVKLLFPDDTVQHAGIVFDENDLPVHIFAGDNKHLYNLQLNSINNYPALTGACVMIRRNVFEELKGFDENFAVEFNDIDFCLRAMGKGYFNIYLPHVELYHYESVSRGKSHDSKKGFEKYYDEKNRFSTQANLELIRNSYSEKLFINS